MALPGFIFDASKGETPQSLAKKRAIIQALMTSRRAPASVPEGIDALGDGIVANVLGRRADKAERDGQESAASAFGPIAGMIAGFPAAPAAPGAIPSGPLSKADPNVGSTIDFARSGMDGYLSNIRAAESGGNDAAKNPLSSATGRYQFTSGTWADVARKYPDLGLTPQGRLDPAQQERAIQAFTRDNAAVLSSARIPVTPGTLYAAHFLGSGGAQKVLSSEPDARVADIVGPEVVRANPFLRGMTVTDFVGWASQKGGGDSPINIGGGRTPPASFPAPEPAAPVQVASLDPSIGMPPTSDTMVPGQPASATPAGGRIVSAMTNPQPMTGGSPLPMQGMPAPQGASMPSMAQNSPAPMQTAQAAPMPEMAGNVAPMQGSGPTLQQLMQAASNPWLNDNQRQVVNMLLEQEMQKQDPMRQLQIQALQKEINAQPERKTVVVNGRLVDAQTGQEIAQYPDQPKPTSDIQEYEYAREQGYQGNFADFQREMKKAGATNVTTTVGGQEQTKGRTKVDEKYAEDFVDWNARGAYADVNKQIQQLEGALVDLETKDGLTGPFVGSMPDSINAIINPGAVKTREMVEEVVQRNLRLVLGAQFTAEEGERLVARAYNPRLGEKENARRVRALITQIRTAAEAKQAASEYFAEHGTLTGWGGKIPTMADFDPDKSTGGDLKSKYGLD